MKKLMFLFVLVLGCSTTDGLKFEKQYPGLRRYQINTSNCAIESSDPNPTLYSFTVGDRNASQKVHGLAFGTGARHHFSADLDWLVKPGEQEIAIIHGEACRFLMKKKNEKTFSVYEVRSPEKFVKIKDTNFDKVKVPVSDYIPDLIAVKSMLSLFGDLVVGLRTTNKEGVYDIGLFFRAQEFNIDDVVVGENYSIFQEARHDLGKGHYYRSNHLVKVLHSDDTESVISSIWNYDSHGALPLGMSKAGEYPAYFTLSDYSKVSYKVTKDESGELNFTLYQNLYYNRLDQKGFATARTYFVPHNAKVVGMKLLVDASYSSGGRLIWDNSDEASFWFDFTTNDKWMPKIALQLKYPDGKKLWHLLQSSHSAAEGIDRRGWLELRQFNDPFPSGTVVGLDVDGKWSVTGYHPSVISGLHIKEITSFKEESLDSLASKITPLVAAREKDFEQRMEADRKRRIAERKAYIESLPASCRQFLDDGPRLQGCLYSVKRDHARQAELAEKNARESRRSAENSRPINWRKGAMSGDNYYHLDVQKRTRQIENKLRCELRIGLCMH